MKISELEPNSKVYNLVATIDSLEEPTQTPNGVNIQEGILSDDTGQVKFTLWDEWVNKFVVGDKVSMSTGWCKSFEEIIQVSTGKFGKIRKVPETPIQE